MKLEEIKEYLTDNGCENAIVFENPAYEDGRAVYNYNAMVRCLVHDDNMTVEDAEEFIDYNTIRALPYMGENKPIIVYEMEE